MAESVVTGQLRQFLTDGGVTYLYVKSSEDGKHERKDLEECDFLDKHCGLYFSAHWCPPCKAYTPKLAKKYNLDISEKMTIIFASWDSDVRAFNSYYSEMPWAAIPFEFKESLEKSKAIERPGGIPSLYLFDDKGSLYQTNGRSAVMDFEFPYADPEFNDILPLIIDDVAGTPSDQNALKEKKYIMLYFSAHWCGPCRNFTPQLCKWYNEFKKTRDDFEIIFCSSDRDEAAFKDYFKDMPFKAINIFGSKSGEGYKSWLSRKCGVGGIPCLTVLNEDRNILRKNARGCVEDDKEAKGVDFPFPMPAIQDINVSIEGINEKPSMILICDEKTGEEQDKLVAMMQPTADAERALEESDSRTMMHFVLKGEGEIARRVRPLFGLKKGDQLLVILNIAKGEYYKIDLPQDADAVQKFADEFKQGILEAHKLG